MNYKEFKKLVAGCKHTGVEEAFLTIYQSNQAADLIDLYAVKAVFATRWERINSTSTCYTMNQEHPENAAYIIIAKGLATQKNFCPSCSSDALTEETTENLYLAEQSTGKLKTRVASKKLKYSLGTYSWLMPTIKKGDKTNALEYFEFYSLQECFVDPDGRLTLLKDILEGLKEMRKLVTRDETFYGPKDIERLLKQFPSKKSAILSRIQNAYKPFEHITENTIRLLEELESFLKECVDFMPTWNADYVACTERMQELQCSAKALLEKFIRLKSSPSLFEYQQVARLKGSPDLICHSQVTLIGFLTRFETLQFHVCMPTFWRDVQHHIRKIRHLRELNKFRSTIESQNDGPCLFARCLGDKQQNYFA